MPQHWIFLQREFKKYVRRTPKPPDANPSTVSVHPSCFSSQLDGLSRQMHSNGHSTIGLFFSSYANIFLASFYKRSMQNPCIDKYGHNTCNLRRFHLLDDPSQKTRSQKTRTPPSRPPKPQPPKVPPSRRPQGAPAVTEAEIRDLIEKSLDAVDDPAGRPHAVPGRIKAAVKSSTMTTEEYTASAMSRAAYIQYSEGEAAARRYAAKHVGDGWSYDAQLSNEMAVVFSRGDESAIAYRGTQDAPGVNADWEANLRNRVGADQLLRATPQEAMIAEQLNAVRAKYPGGIALTTGHSRGGAEALKTATKATVDRVITFNSASYGLENVFPTRTKVTSLRTVGRLSGDLVSASGDALSVGRVKYVKSTYGENPATGLHDLRNFERTPYEPPTLPPPAPEGIEMTDVGVAKAPRPNAVVPDTEVLAPKLQPAPPPDRVDEFGSLTDLFEENSQLTKPVKIPTSVTGALSQTGVGVGVGYGVSKIYQQLGVSDPYANATMTGATTGGLLSGGGEALASSVLSKSMSRAAVRSVLSSTAQGMAEGLIFAPIGVGVDKLTNIGYRAAGADKATAGALSGASSALALGGISAGVAASSASVAAGELAFGPEMLPIAAATFFGGAIASWLGFQGGAAEEKRDDAIESRRQTAKAQNYLSTLLASGDYASYDEARAAMTSRRPSWVENLGDGFESEATDTLDGTTHGSRPTYATVEQLQKQRKAALTSWNNSAHYSGHGLRYGSLFWNSAPASVTSKYDQRIAEAKYRDIANRYLSAYITAQANNRLDVFKTPLSEDEQTTLTHMDPDWMAHLQTTANLVHAHQVMTAQRLNAVQESMLAAIAAGETIDLTPEQTRLLQENDVQAKAIMSRVHDVENQRLLRDTITHTADALNISYADLAQYYDNVNAGMTPDRAWKQQAHSQGFFSVAEYELFRSKDPEAHLEEVMTEQRHFAQKALDLHAKAMDAGYDNVDQFLIEHDPDFDFSANASEIATAHEFGMTVPEYMQYMRGVVDAPSKDAQYGQKWDAYMYKLAKSYTDVRNSKAPTIDTVDEAAQYARETHIQQAMHQKYAPTETYVDPRGDIVDPGALIEQTSHPTDRPHSHFSDAQMDMLKSSELV